MILWTVTEGEVDESNNAFIALKENKFYLQDQSINDTDSS